MSDSNLYISNGTCYTTAGKELDKGFIPCGNDAFNHQTCCGSGDNCLADNACFGVHGSGYGSMLTYMAGCTDRDYKDPKCPDKKGINQPWIALTLCDNADGIWGACSQQGDPMTLQPGSYCSCTEASSFTPIAFSDSTSLASIASLPTGTGASIQFAPGHTPISSTKAIITISQSNTEASDSGGTPIETGSALSPTTTASIAASTAAGTSGSPSVTSSSKSNSTSGKIIGISVGASVAILVLLVAIMVFVLLRRRHRRSAASAATAADEINNRNVNDATSNNGLGTTGRISRAENASVSEADGRPISKADQPGTFELYGASILEADSKGVSKASKPGTFELDSNALVEADGYPTQPLVNRDQFSSRPRISSNAG